MHLLCTRARKESGKQTAYVASSTLFLKAVIMTSRGSAETEQLKQNLNDQMADVRQFVAQTFFSLRDHSKIWGLFRCDESFLLRERLSAGPPVDW